MKVFLRLFFRLLYHQFAFTYDLVAAAVSLNHWKDWVVSVVPFVEGPRVLEIGHGPGHLQRVLLTLRDAVGQWPKPVVVGIDESAQMGRMARRNLTSQHSSSPHYGYTKINLTRGVAQHLPFPSESFDTILATFPTEYIEDAKTLEEIKRCLAKQGRLIVLPVALPKNKFLDWLFKITHQRPTDALEVIQAKLAAPFQAAGFQTKIKTLDVNSGILLIVQAMKNVDE